MASPFEDDDDAESSQETSDDSMSVASSLVFSSSSLVKSKRGRPKRCLIRQYFDYDSVTNQSTCNISVSRQDASGEIRRMPCGYTYTGMQFNCNMSSQMGLKDSGKVTVCFLASLEPK